MTDAPGGPRWAARTLLKGGLQMITLSTNKGAFAGGGWAEVKPSLAKPLNDEIYGSNADVNQIRAARGGQYRPAIKVRHVLSQIVVEVWGSEGGAGPPVSCPSLPVGRTRLPGPQ